MSEGDTGASSTATMPAPVDTVPVPAPAEPVIETPAAAEPPPIPTSTPVSQTPATPAPEMPAQTPSPEIPQPSPAPQPVPPSNPTATISSYLSRALDKIQFRKRAKLEKVLALAAKKRSIKNDDVEKLLRVSDSTAQRYLNQLVREGKLRRIGSPKQPTYEPV